MQIRERQPAIPSHICQKGPGVGGGIFAASVMLLVLLAFMARLYKLDSQSLWWDETLSVHRAERGFAYIMSNRITIFEDVTIDQHPPLYFFLLRAALLAFGNTEFALRFLSVIAMMLAIPITYRLGKDIWDERAGFTAALVAGVSPFYLWYAQEARPYAWVAMLATLASHLLFKYVRTSSNGALMAYVLTAIALLATHFLTVALVAAQVLFLAVHSIWMRRRPAAAAVTAICGLVIVAEALPISARYLSQPGGPLAEPFIGVLRDIIVSFTFGPTVDQFSVLPFALGIVAMVAVGYISSSDRLIGVRALLLLIGFALPLCIIYVLSLYKSVYGTRYVMFLAPAYYGILGVAGSILYSRSRIIGWLFAASIIGAGVVGGYDYLVVNNNDKQDFKSVVQYISERARSNDAIVLDDKKIVTAFDYYYKGNARLYGVPRYPVKQIEAVDPDLRAITSEHQRIWLVTTMAGEIDPYRTVEAWLSNKCYLVDKRVFTGRTYSIDVRLYSVAPYTVPDLPPEASRITASLGGQLDLVGYSIGDKNEGGNVVELVLYWRPLAAGLPRLAVFGQVIDGDGNAWGAFDGEPFNGFYGTDKWDRSSLIADRREIIIIPGVPPGRYSLRVGVRRVSDSELLPVRNEFGEQVGSTVLLVDALQVDQSSGEYPDVLPLAQRYGANIGDGITLLGGDTLPDQVSPGDDVSFRLFWRGERDRPDSVDVEISLERPNTQRKLVLRQPISRNYPVEGWRKREIVGAFYTFSIPAQIESGTYAVNMRFVRPGRDAYLAVKAGMNIFSTDTVQVGRISVSVPPRRFVLDSDLNWVRANLSDRVELIGFGVAGDNVFVTQGDDGVWMITLLTGFDNPLTINLWWKALSQMEVNYTVFLQLLNSESEIVDQHDGVPAGATRPTRGWIRDELVEDKHVLSKVQTLRKGTYLLIGGMYDPKTGQRMQLRDRSGDYIAIAKVIVR